MFNLEQLFAQRIFDKMMGLPEQGIRNKLQLKVLKFVGKLVLEYMNDPKVVYRIGANDLILPLSHALPTIRKAYPHYSTNVARIAKFVKTKYPDLKFIDIGANVGDTVALMREIEDFPILCIEGDERFYALLEQNARRWDDVDLVKAFVGESDCLFHGSIETAGGTGHLVENAHIGTTLRMQKLSSIVKENPKYSSAKMIKIDTDGFDCKILKSARQVLSDLKPVLFYEYDPYFFNKVGDEGYEVFDVLRACGYSNLLIYENTGEFLLSASLDDEKLLRDVDAFYTGWKGRRYCDICAFHQEDADLAERVALFERAFYCTERLNEGPL